MKKLVYFILTSVVGAFTFSSYTTPTLMNANTSIYDLKFNSIDGEEIALSQFKGKHILFVNVASECGYTPQYKELQSLHEMQKENLVIIGYPCNQFGGQEPGEAKEIATFCEKNYGVTFLLSEKN